MSFEAIQTVRLLSLPRLLHDVAMVLADHCNADKLSWPSQERIADEARYCLRSVYAGCKELCRRGIVSRTLRDNGSHLYKFEVEFVSERVKREKDPPLLSCPVPAMAAGPSPADIDIPPAILAGESTTKDSDLRSARAAKPSRPQTPRNQVWTEGRAALAATARISRDRAGSIIGKLLGKLDHDYQRLLDLLREMRSLLPEHPLNWLFKAVGTAPAARQEAAREQVPPKPQPSTTPQERLAAGVAAYEAKRQAILATRAAWPDEFAQSSEYAGTELGILDSFTRQQRPKVWAVVERMAPG